MKELAKQGTRLSLLRQGVIGVETNRQPSPEAMKREKPICISNVMELTRYSRSYTYMLVH
jgi:hypothetical protein